MSALPSREQSLLRRGGASFGKARMSRRKKETKTRCFLLLAEASFLLYADFRRNFSAVGCSGRMQSIFFISDALSRSLSKAGGVSCAFSDNKKRTSADVRIFSGRDDWIRTSGLFVPNEARYQTVPHPVNTSNIITEVSSLVNHLEKYFSKNVQSVRRGAPGRFSRPVGRTFRVAWRFFFFIVTVGSGAEESWRGAAVSFSCIPLLLLLH